MRKLNFKPIIRRGTAMLLLAATLIGVIPGGVKEARADSNDLRKTYIQLMSGVSAVNVDSIEQLSVNDLRCIALYLSNFYIPYATSLDDTEQQEKNEQYMVNALKGIGFKDDTARNLINTVYQASLSSAKELYIREDQLYTGSVNVTYKGIYPFGHFEYDINTDVALGLSGTGFTTGDPSFFGIIYKSSQDGEAVPFEDKVVTEETTYYPLTMFAYNALPERYVTRYTSSILNMKVYDSAGGKDGSRIPIEFSWSDGGTMIPCFELNDFTCSFIKEFADAVDLSDGSGGMAVLNTSCEDFNTLKEKERQALCTLTQRLYVDWVGNILCDFGDKRVIIYPACMNPYAFDMIGETPIVSSDVEAEESEGEAAEGEPFYTNGRRTAFSLISSWGLWFLGRSESKIAAEETEQEASIKEQVANFLSDKGFSLPSWLGGNSKDDSDTETESDLEEAGEEVFQYARGGVSTWDLKMYRGSGTSANWNDKNSTSGAQAAKEKIDAWGYSTGEFKDGWFTGGEINPALSFYSFDFSVDKSDILTEVLVYKSITNKEIDALDNGSMFISWDIFNEGRNYFTQSNKFTVKSNDFSAYMQFSDGDYQMLKNIFLTYVFAYNNRDAKSFDVKKHYVDMKFCASNFPESMDTSIVWDSLDTDNEKITSFIYYLLHPWEGVKYVTTLVKNKLSGILVGFHEDIVGGTESNSTTGMTKYLGFTGYVTSPSLREIDWIDSLLSGYSNMVVYLIIAMCVIICCYLITGQMRIGRAILGVLFFGVMAMIPPVALNFAADKVNLFCDTIYSGKFDYWSYTQMETYLAKIGSTQSASSTYDYISRLMDLQMNETQGSKIGFSGVKVKWMTPKKIHTGQEASNELENVLDNSFSSLFISIIGNAITSMDRGEEYIDSINATYLYRDLCDIYMYAACSYNLYTSFNGDNMAYSIGEGNINKWSPTENYTLGELTYSSGESLGDYVMPNYDEYAVSGDSIYDLTSSAMAAGYGFLHDNSMNRSRELDNYYNARTGYYVPTNDAYVNQQSGLALGFPFALMDTYDKIHRNYEALMADLSEWSDGDSVDINLNNIAAHIYGLDPKTFDLSLQSFQKNASSVDISSENSSGETNSNKVSMDFENLSGFYYALYAESPFYFFNNHFRDYVVSHHPDYAFSYPLYSRNSKLYKVFLDNNQDFFFNYSSYAGDGYGELRDFMGMHDLFYYVIPLLSEGNKIADTFDSIFGMYVNDDTPLQILNNGKIRYGGKEADNFEELINMLNAGYAGVRAKRDEDGSVISNRFEELTPEQKYKLWHDYNVWTIFQSYVPWVDTMEDCHYAKPEIIRVAGQKFEVTNPLDPTCYYTVDENGEMVDGRLMVFSPSEMEFYGLNTTDLTSVERKIIQVQENVYKHALDLMNYYTLSDEVLINAFSMLQVFEFNRAFSQDSVFGKSYLLFPQGYESKAFTYDAYLRLVVAEASGESIQVDSGNSGDTSIYRRVLQNTSIFFGVILLVNDFMAVYIIPVLKVAILLLLFFTSIFLIIGAAIRIEFNPLQTIWQSLLAPLGSYVLINIGFAWIVSLFMSNGASGVVQTSKTITIGDPTTVLLIMICIHVAVMIMLFKVCKKCFKDFKTSIVSVADNITSTALGAAAVIGGTVTGAKKLRARNTENGYPGSMASTASQRGVQNTSSFSSVFGGAAGGAMAGAALGANMGAMSADAREAAQRADDRYAARKGLNKYDAKAYDKATAKEDRLRGKYESLSKKSSQAAYRGDQKASTKYDMKMSKLQQRRNNAAKYAQDISDGGRLYAYNNKAKGTIYGISSRASGMARQASNVLSDMPGNIGYAAGRARTGVDHIASATSSAIRNAPGAIRSAADDVYTAVGRAPSAAKGMALRGLSAAESYGNKAVGTVVQTKRYAMNSALRAKRNFDTGYGIGRGSH